jgi:hypothetical protein
MDKARRALSLALLPMLATAGVAPKTEAASAAEAIDADVDVALTRFYRHVHGSRQLVRKAIGVLVFPTVINTAH